MSTKIEKKLFRKTYAASLLFVHFTHIRKGACYSVFIPDNVKLFHEKSTADFPLGIEQDILKLA